MDFIYTDEFDNYFLTIFKIDGIPFSAMIDKVSKEVIDISTLVSGVADIVPTVLICKVKRFTECIIHSPFCQGLFLQFKKSSKSSFSLPLLIPYFDGQCNCI